MCVVNYFIFFCKQKTAYEMRISDWSSDVCSSDLDCAPAAVVRSSSAPVPLRLPAKTGEPGALARRSHWPVSTLSSQSDSPSRSEENTSELQSLMRISYAVFCLKKTHTKPTSKSEG